VDFSFAEVPIVMLRVVVALAALHTPPQFDGASPPRIPTADSVVLFRSAQNAQRAFESFRRARLPMGNGGSNPCDVRIGRYCYWRGDETETEEPTEKPEFSLRRTQLLALLDSASTLLPGDSWIAGQRVRYLVEAKRPDDAIRFAREQCKAPASWCAALAGYAAHVGGQYVLADSAFGDALAKMDSSERCKWIDISPLLDEPIANRFHDLDCARREALMRHIFWLGSPLYSVSNADLRTEHFARITRTLLAERSANAEGQPWADDIRELVLRYGWSRWHTRSPPRVSDYNASPSITGHDSGVPYNFIPAALAIDSLGAIGPDGWKLSDQFARAGYAPAYAKTVHDLPGQIALFRRGDSTLAVAAWDARKDETMLGRTLDAALVLATPAGSAAVTRQANSKTVGRITVTGVIDSGVVSLELFSESDRRAARLRGGVVGPGSGLDLSDLLLYAPDTAPAYELSAVRDSALASSVIAGSRGVGVYWETYGLEPNGEPVRYTLTVEQVGVSWLRRAAEALRFSDPSSSLRIQWTEVPQRRGDIAGRGVRVDLSRLRAGRYRVELSAATDGGGSATTFREIEVRQ
jgi:hypothetical protein